MLYHALIFACLIAVCALLAAEYKRIEPLRWTSKIAASLCFVSVAIVLGAAETAYGSLILAGLVLCLAGDAFLLPASKTSFLAGMGAFALGHIAYVAAFISVSDEISGLSIAMLAVMAAISYGALKLMWRHLAEFRWPVVGYTVIISVMVAASFSASPGGHSAPYWLIAAGAFGFAVSDLAVARDQFVERNFFNRLWGLPLYFGSQLLIASSV